MSDPVYVFRRIGTRIARLRRVKCRRCGREWEVRLTTAPPQFCSDACRREHRREYNREYQRRRRASRE